MGTMFVNDVSTLPTSGSAWTFLLNREAALSGAAVPGTNVPNLSRQDDWTQTNALCSALAWKKIGLTGNATRLTKLQSLLKAVPGTQIGTAQPLNCYRQIGCWVTVADMIDFPASTVCNNGQTWGAFCDSLFTWTFSGTNANWNTLDKCSSLCGANWGGYARHALVALSIYRGNATKLAQAINYTKRFLGDTTIANTFVPTADFVARGASWTTPGTFPTTQGVINPAGVGERSGCNVEDVTRTGIAFTPGCTAAWNGQTPGTTYQLENAEAVWATFVLLHNAGYDDCWYWQSNAMQRNYLWIKDYGHGFTAPTYSMYQAIPYLVNKKYGGSVFPQVGESGNTGRAAAGYSWLAQAASWVAGGVTLASGANLATVTAANPAGTTFYLGDGTYTLTTFLIPKSGNKYIAVNRRMATITGLGTNNAGIKGSSGEAGQKDVTLDGLIVTGMANPNTAPYLAAVQCGWRWTVNDCDIHTNDQIGLIVNQGCTITNNEIHDNDRYALSGGPTANDLLIENNHIYDNNIITQYAIGNAGGTKILRSARVTWRNNHVHDNYGAGIHGDSGNSEWLIENNNCHDNWTFGISFECSGSAVGDASLYGGMICRNNTLTNNCQTAAGQSLFFGADIYLNDGKNAEIYGNTIVAGVHGIGLRDNFREGNGPVGTGSELETGVNEVSDVYVHDNVVTLPPGGQTGMVGSGRPAAYLPPNGVVFEGNIYHVDAPTNGHWRWDNSITGFAPWQAIPQDATGSAGVGATVVVPFLQATTLYAPSVTRGSRTVVVPLLSVATVVHSPAVTRGVNTVTASFLNAAPTLHQPSVAAGTAIAVQPDYLNAAASLALPAVTSGAISVAANYLNAAATLFTPTVTTPQSYASEVLADSPLIYWRLGEASGTTAQDTSPNNNDGTYINTPTLGAAGLIANDANTAVAFTGGNDEAVFSVASFGPITYSSFALEAVIDLASLGAGDLPHVCGWNNTQFLVIYCDGDDQTINGEWTGVFLKAPITLGPTHVAVTFDGTTAKLFVNGALVDSQAASDAVFSGGDQFRVGDDGFNDNFDGIIDEVAFYDTCPSPTRIAVHAVLAGLSVQEIVAPYFNAAPTLFAPSVGAIAAFVSAPYLNAAGACFPPGVGQATTPTPTAVGAAVYRTQIVDMFGVPETVVVGNPGRITRVKNETGSATFAFPKLLYPRTKIMPLGAADGVREVQIYRNDDLMFWGPMLHPSAASNAGGVTMECAGLEHYFDQRLLDGQRTNRITDPSFEAADLSAWTVSPGLTATQDTTKKVLGTKSLKLVNSTPLVDASVQQSFTVDGGLIGVFLQPAGHFLIESITGPALDSRGLYIEGVENGIVQANNYYAIDAATFELYGARWIRAEMEHGFWVPPNRTWTINVRVYPVQGTIYWDALQLVAEESVSTAGITGTVDGEVDIAKILEMYVRHLQNPAVGKSDVNIGTNCPNVGTALSKHVQYVDHVDWGQAKAEFVGRDDGIDVWIATTPTTRSLTCATRKGVDRTGTVTLTFGTPAFKSYTYDEDGGVTVTRATVTGDGDGPDREEGEVADASQIGGLILQDVRAAPAKTQINSLVPLAQRTIDRYKTPPVILTVYVAESAGLIHTLDTGDRIHVVINDGWVQVDGDFEIVRWELDCKTSLLALTLNQEP